MIFPPKNIKPVSFFFTVCKHIWLILDSKNLARQRFVEIIFSHTAIPYNPHSYFPGTKPNICVDSKLYFDISNS